MKLLVRILFKGVYNYLKNPNQRKFMWLVFRYGDKKRFIRKSITFNKFRLIVPDSLSFIWQYKEIFVEESYKFLTKSNAPLIVDCGANIGVSICYFKWLFPNANILAFESNVEISEILKENIEKNQLNNIQVFNKAVWINDEGVEMTSNLADNSSVFGIGKKDKIPSVRLKSILQDEKRNIDLLKIDIEGAEVEVIKDCSDYLEKVNHIFIEYHSFLNNRQELDEILLILRNKNFRYFIKPVNDRLIPFINKTNKNYPQCDLQLNIYAYKL